MKEAESILTLLALLTSNFEKKNILTNSFILQNLFILTEISKQNKSPKLQIYLWRLNSHSSISNINISQKPKLSCALYDTMSHYQIDDLQRFRFDTDSKTLSKKIKNYYLKAEISVWDNFETFLTGKLYRNALESGLMALKLRGNCVHSRAETVQVEIDVLESSTVNEVRNSLRKACEEKRLGILFDEERNRPLFCREEFEGFVDNSDYHVFEEVTNDCWFSKKMGTFESSPNKIHFSSFYLPTRKDQNGEDSLNQKLSNLSINDEYKNNLSAKQPFNLKKNSLKNSHLIFVNSILAFLDAFYCNDIEIMTRYLNNFEEESAKLGIDLDQNLEKTAKNRKNTFDNLHWKFNHSLLILSLNISKSLETEKEPKLEIERILTLLIKIITEIFSEIDFEDYGELVLKGNLILSNLLLYLKIVLFKGREYIFKTNKTTSDLTKQLLSQISSFLQKTLKQTQKENFSTFNLQNQKQKQTQKQKQNDSEKNKLTNETIKQKEFIKFIEKIEKERKFYLEKTFKPLIVKSIKDIEIFQC